LGTAILEFVEDEGYDRNLRSPILASAIVSIKNGTDFVVRNVSGLLGSSNESQSSDKPKEGIREKVAAAKATTLEKITASKEKAKNAKDRVVEVADSMKTKVEKTASTAKDLATGAASSVQKSSQSAATETKKAAIEFSEGVEDLVRLAEAALAGKPIERLPEATTTPSQPAAAPPDVSPKLTDTPELTAGDVVAAVKEATDGKVYTELPVGFEPPPGYSKPKPAKLPEPSTSASKESSKPAPLPKVAPSVAEISKSEPVISHLASTIDALAAYLAENPSASTNAASVLENAEKDLKELVSRIERVREEEHDKLDMAMDEQARAYAMKLLETELAARDKLDEQELEFRQFLELERQEAMRMYREKLAKELETQSEIINER
jgi:mitofilin